MKQSITNTPQCLTIKLALHFIDAPIRSESRDSSVGTATGYGLGIFLLSTTSRTALGPTELNLI